VQGHKRKHPGRLEGTLHGDDVLIRVLKADIAGAVVDRRNSLASLLAFSKKNHRGIISWQFN
jgi:hypothetical protein